MAKSAKKSAKASTKKSKQAARAKHGKEPDLFAGKAPAKPAKGKKGEYGAAQIEVLEGLEPVRRRPGMYVGGTDERALHHLFAEVIDNSMDEAVAGHASRIEVELSADMIVTIRDNGPGIAEEDFNRVFNSFFTTKEEGMGIGLAICQSIIAAHGGAIGAANLPEGGARFWFSLPAGR